MSEGWCWPFDEEHKLPTFTRSIPRRRPPPRPAGLCRCLPHEVARWERDSCRYPLYTYRDERCLRNSPGDFRILKGAEREVLSGLFRVTMRLSLSRTLGMQRMSAAHK